MKNSEKAKVYNLLATIVQEYGACISISSEEVSVYPNVRKAYDEIHTIDHTHIEYGEHRTLAEALVKSIEYLEARYG